MTENSTSSVGERLAAIHLALAKSCIAWKRIFYSKAGVTLTSDQALEMADFFARAAFEVRDAAALLGISLSFCQADQADTDHPPPSTPPYPIKPGLTLIEGGKK